MTNDSKDIMQYAAHDGMEIWRQAKAPLDNFMKEIGNKPKADLIKKNKFANNASYLEIGYLEAKLDQIYHGLWNWDIDHSEQMVNGVSVRGTLSVFHPVAQTWIRRSGIAFKEFQLKKGETEPAPANMSSKAGERDIPIAAAEAFKNAAKKLGNTFGRHLNRQFKYDYVADGKIMERILGEKKSEPDV